MGKRRVVVTGIGTVSPNGIGKENVWKGMSNGVSGVRLVDGFDVSVFNTKIAAEVRDFDPFKLGLTHEEAMRMDRYVQFVGLFFCHACFCFGFLFFGFGGVSGCSLMDWC